MAEVIGGYDSNAETSMDRLRTITVSNVGTKTYLDVMHSEHPYALRQVVVSDVLTYIGEAEPGALTSAASWRVKKVQNLGGNTIITWADGNAKFDNIWDNYASLTYS